MQFSEGFFEDLASLTEAEQVTWWTEKFSQLTTEEQDQVLEAFRNWEWERAPSNDAELHAWCIEHLDIHIPKIAVCPDHVAPFKFLADLYFERVLSALAMANRGGSKTFMAALWLYLAAKFNPGTEGASVASEQQTKRAYEHLKKIIRAANGVQNEADADEIESSILRETRWKNKSLYEIIIATMSGTSGPHPQKVHTDEVEWIEPPVFQNSRNMSQSKGKVKAQDVLTSTRYRGHGQMQQLWDECDNAIKNGLEPPYERYQWCVFETAQRVDNCQSANPDLPEDQRCNCDKIAKGEWSEGTPRRFSDICQGRLSRSDGWVPLHDLHKTFRTTTRDVWEAQQECIKPSTEGLVIPEYDETRHGIRGFLPDPANGPIYASVDFGGTNPHAVILIQLLMQDVYARGFHQGANEEPTTLLVRGSRVCFDEIYIAEVAPSKLADLVFQKIDFWRAQFPNFHVQRFFYDIQAKGARLEWATHEPPIFLVNFASKDVQLHITYIKDLIEENQFWINLTKAPMLNQELNAWRFPDKTGMKAANVDSPDQPVKDFDHAVDAMRYGLANIRAIELKGQQERGGGDGGGTGSGPSGWGGGGGGGSSGTGSGHSPYQPQGHSPHRPYGPDAQEGGPPTLPQPR